MSRSYKKAEYSGDKKDKELKRLANHRVRQYLKQHIDFTPGPSDYKKLFDSWEICDYGELCSWKEWWDRENEWFYSDHYSQWKLRTDVPPNKKEEHAKWYKYYKMK